MAALGVARGDDADALAAQLHQRGVAVAVELVRVDVAITRNGEPVAGLTWVPFTGERFTGIVGKPLRSNGAEQRRAQGEKFWWYVCTGPKAPYCGLFIDHAGTELRVWLWQTWQRGVEAGRPRARQRAVRVPSPLPGRRAASC